MTDASQSGTSVEDLVLGHVLDSKRSGRGGGDASGRLGSPKERRTRGLLRNAGAPRGWQSVVKRIAGGSARTPQELKRLLDYVAREDGVQSTWCNLAGYERDFDPGKTGKLAAAWSSTWRGAPKRGHADHIVLSFPRGVDGAQAEVIAREWGEAVFGSGDHGDVWRYVGALHKDTDHVHAHFVVDKHGIDHGWFLSICRYSALNFDVMRELHAEISQAHGLNILATSRLSRGLIENPARDRDVNAAAHRPDKTAPPTPPPLSDAERTRRLEEMQAFASDYDELGRIAGIAAGSGKDTESATNFFARLAHALGASADALRQGLPLMPDLSLHTEGDAASKIEAARAGMVAAASDAWEAIRAMEPSAERVDLERSFADQARASLKLAPENPLLAEHARVVSREEDPYFHPTLASLARLDAGTAEGVSLDAGLRETLSHVREEIGERLTALFSLREDDLRAAGTTAEEMVARFVAPERSLGQLVQWSSQDGPEAKVLWMEAERDLTREVGRTLDTLELTPSLTEAIAKDQLLSADRNLRLSDVPALEAIVDRVQESLPREDLDRVLAGDLALLAEQVRDPALRAAVAHELKNEGDLGPDDAVGRWADLARSQSRAAELGQRDRVSERDPSLEL
ncbi:MAG: relaxase/mobilization nuclease domain-containing protein [Gemmobacter sp.]